MNSERRCRIFYYLNVLYWYIFYVSMKWSFKNEKIFSKSEVVVHCAAVDCTHCSSKKMRRILVFWNSQKTQNRRNYGSQNQNTKTYQKKKISTCVIFNLIVTALKEGLG